MALIRDDFQSMVHFLVFTPTCSTLRGSLSSPYGPGRKEHVLSTSSIGTKRDYANLRTYSPRYPTPDAPTSEIAQAGSDRPLAHRRRRDGRRKDRSGSSRSARRNDPRPLWVVVWGGIDDLAQALHDAPDILPKLRVYFIGGPNKMWSADAFTIISNSSIRPLWMIEANATYRGWFTGGDQTGEWNNTAFVTGTHCRSRTRSATFFATQVEEAPSRWATAHR